MKKIAVIAVIAATLSLHVIRPALSADAWPSRPIRWIVPVAPGGATDATARIIQDPVSKILGQQIVIENKAGGSGVIATSAVVNADPDGYTFGLIYTSHAANPSLLASLPYDSEKDITPVAFFWRAWESFDVSKNAPFGSVKELIDASKKAPIPFGTGGVGQASHLAGEDFALRSGAAMKHVPYNGAGPALNDLLGGQLQMMIGTISVVQPFVDNGLRVIAVASPERSPLLPGVPTVAESGFPGFQASEWIGFIGPAKLPPAIAEKMNAAIWQAVQQPEVIALFQKMGIAPTKMSPAEFGEFLKEETQKTAEIVKRANIKP